MFLLTSKIEDKFEFKNITLSLDMSFDNILSLFELFEDDLFGSYEKILIAVEMLIIEYEEIKDESFDVIYEIYKYVLKEFLNIQVGSNDENNGQVEGSGPQKKLMNFSKDAGLIYASFLSEYKIDLFDEQGKLHWYKFSELLAHLGKDTAFKQVVSYRDMKIPNSKEASEEYRNHIRKMKRIYSLDDTEDKQENIENTLDSIASTFRGGKSDK